MPDTFGRVGTDQRVSITGRCNLRCSYRMPVGGLPWDARVLTVPVNPRVSTVRVCRRVGLPVESMDGTLR
jgi:cyclic pyranopterin phosphate synthase